MPRALILSLAISTILYILVALSAVSIVGWETLASSKAPLTEVVEVAIPQASIIMSVIALFATANTALIIFIVASRMLYGLSSNHSLPGIFGRIGSRGTPYVSVFIVMLFGLLALLIGGIKTIALLTDVGIFLVYVLVNISLIIVRYRDRKSKPIFKVPFNIGWFPLTAFLGLITSLFILSYFEPVLLLYEGIVIVIGFIIYKIINGK